MGHILLPNDWIISLYLFLNVFRLFAFFGGNGTFGIFGDNNFRDGGFSTNLSHMGNGNNKELFPNSLD